MKNRLFSLFLICLKESSMKTDFFVELMSVESSESLSSEVFFVLKRLG